MVEVNNVQHKINNNRPYRAHRTGCTPLHSLMSIGNFGFVCLMLT